ncbi:MAG TPA: serine hydrolase [Herpetosiphonaceae bacterium]|nr:serine hydrolase [Herpetosiphonaceae bacterium]
MTADHQLPGDTPEAQGIPSSAILAFVDAAEEQNVELHSLMLLRNEHVVAEGWWAPYRPDSPHMLFSLSKSFTSTALGLAVAEGRLKLDDPVLSFFPDDAPAEVSENLAAMRVRHLLSMSTGHVEDTINVLARREEVNWVRAFLSRPVEHEPGTHFLYNSGATYILSAILQHLTGITLLDYLRPRLLDPLGIEEATWESSPQGINTGGWGLSIKTEGIARFGQLYLQQGMWQGRQIVPQTWVAEATACQVSNGSNPDSDWEQGYGYQFWRCRHGAYRGDGAFGQFCVVMPEQDVVLAITGGQGDMQAVLNLVWEHLLPAMGPRPLSEDRATQDELVRRLADLSLPIVQGQDSSQLAEKVSGRAFAFEDNEQQAETISFDFGGDGCSIAIRNHSGSHRIACGSGTWLEGTTSYDDGVSRPAAATGAWTADDTYVIKLRYIETPFGFTLTCRFVEDRVLLDHQDNVSFGPTERPCLVGWMV